MRILTTAMQVLDSRATLKLAADRRDIDPRGAKFVCNPFDEFAIEQALRWREGRADVQEVVALTIGNTGALESLRVALAMGADRGVHVCADRLPMHDEIALAELSAAAIRREPAPFDLILCGKQIIDNDSGEFGPALAELLDLPHVGAAVKLELSADGSVLRANRRVEGGEEIIECRLPALITCEKGLVEPRYPALPNILKAKKKPVTTLTAAEMPELAKLAAGTELLELTPPPPRPPCRFIQGQPQQMAQELARLLREEAKVV